MEERLNLPGTIEAVLFAHGEPMSVERLASITKVSVPEAEQALATLSEALDADQSRGLAILKSGASVQLVTHPRHQEAIANLLRGEMSQDLGAAAVETLALVAYFGPVTRSVIDHVRGVSSAVSLRTLMVRGMIERVRGEAKGENRYQVTPDLLREMGITNREDLPDFGELSQLLTRSLAAKDAVSSDKKGNLEPES